MISQARVQHKMGINAGIVVVKQITDEHKWFQAMNHIQNEFKGEDYFVILPRFNKEAFTVEAFEKLMLTEDMNFSSTGSTSLDWHWNPWESKLREPTLFEFAVKGQLISEQNCGVLKFSKNATKYC